MNNLLQRMAALGSGACNIVANQRASRKAETLGAYLRLKARQGLGQPARNGVNPSVQLFGQTIEYLDLETLVYVFEEIFARHDYHFSTTSAQPLVVDCGANIGLSVLHFKRLYPDCRVVAFEPDPQTFAMLRRNAERNGWSNVELHSVALAAAPGSVQLFTDPDRPGSPLMTTRPGRLDKKTIEVPAEPLSKYISSHVDFLKMDIEGAEGAVLCELARTGKLTSVRQMVVEYHHHLHPSEDSLSQILQLLEQNGFGYQIAAAPARPFGKREFQDILIYAYRNA